MNKQTQPKPVLTLDDIKEMTGVKSSETIIKWIRSGQLKASKPSKKYLVRVHDFNQFLEKNMVKVSQI